MKHWVGESRSTFLRYYRLTNEELCKIINLDYRSKEFYDFEEKHQVSIHIKTLQNIGIEREVDDELDTWYVEFRSTSNSESEAIAEWIKITTGIE